LELDREVLGSQSRHADVIGLETSWLPRAHWRGRRRVLAGYWNALPCFHRIDLDCAL